MSAVPELLEAPLPFSVEYAATLIVGSFRFSQGDARFQPAILQYLAAKFYDQLSVETVNASLDRATQITTHVLHNGWMHKTVELDPENGTPDAQINEIVEGYVDELSECLKDSKEVNVAGNNIDYLAKTTIDKDVYHLYDRKGRKRSLPDGAPRTEFNDPGLSFWVYYGLMAQDTGMPEYNTMFRDMVTDFQAAQGYSDDKRSWSTNLVGRYIAEHPEHAGLLI